MAFDAATGQMIAFGTVVTQAGNWPAPDTWVWDGTRWGQAATTGATPPTRLGASLAYDPVRKVVIMHGGYDQRTNWLNDVWAWNGTGWAQLSPANSPPADGYVREQPLCWDGQKGVVLMVNEQGNAGGIANPVQTWSWDGSTWTQMAVAGAPSLGIGFQFMAVAYDSARKVTVMFSQVNGVPTTWTFDGTSWAQAATSGTVAMSFAMGADDAHSRMVIFGSAGDTWTWDGSKWTVQTPLHSPPGGGIYAMAYDPDRHVVVLLANEPSGTQTWTWNGSDWTPRA